MPPGLSVDIFFLLARTFLHVCCWQTTLSSDAFGPLDFLKLRCLAQHPLPQCSLQLEFFSGRLLEHCGHTHSSMYSRSLGRCGHAHSSMCSRSLRCCGHAHCSCEVAAWGAVGTHTAHV